MGSYLLHPCSRAHLTSRDRGNAGDCREQSRPCARGIPFIPQGTLSTSSWQPRLASRPFHGLTFSHLVLNIIGAAGRESVGAVRRLGYSPRGRGSYIGFKRTVGAIGAAGRECLGVVRYPGYSPRGRGSYTGIEKNCRSDRRSRSRMCGAVRRLGYSQYSDNDPVQGRQGNCTSIRRDDGRTD